MYNVQCEVSGSDSKLKAYRGHLDFLNEVNKCTFKGNVILKERRLRWYGHVERSNGAVKTAFRHTG